MISKSNILAVVLAGGAGSRLAGEDKGLVNWYGDPLVSHVLSAVAPQVASVMLCANRNIERYQEFGYPVLLDDIQGHAGPMAGISTAIRAAQQSNDFQAILVSSCDSPSLPDNYVEKLADQIQAASVAVVHDGLRRQNLHCLIKHTAWASLLQFFDQGGRAMHQWFSQNEVVDVDFAHQTECFSNINTPQHLNSADENLERK